MRYVGKKYRAVGLLLAENSTKSTATLKKIIRVLKLKKFIFSMIFLQKCVFLNLETTLNCLPTYWYTLFKLLVENQQINYYLPKSV